MKINIMSFFRKGIYLMGRNIELCIAVVNHRQRQEITFVGVRSEVLSEKDCSASSYFNNFGRYFESNYGSKKSSSTMIKRS